MNDLDERARRAAAAVHHNLAEHPLQLPDDLNPRRRHRRAAWTLIVLLTLGATAATTWQALDTGGEQVAIRTGEESDSTTPSARATVPSAAMVKDSSSTTVTSVPAATVSTVPEPPGSRAQRWIGLVDPGTREIAPGIKKQSWSAISFDPTYAVVLALDGDHEMLWFERDLPATAEHAAGTALIVDAIDVPPSPDGQRSFIVSQECEIGGKVDPEIVAVLGPPTDERTPNGTPITTRLAFAWRFNRLTEQIEAIPTSGMVCPDDRYGGE